MTAGKVNLKVKPSVEMQIRKDGKLDVQKPEANLVCRVSEWRLLAQRVGNHKSINLCLAKMLSAANESCA